MNHTPLTRRLLAGAASLLVGAAGGLAFGAPAWATYGDDEEQLPSFTIDGDCEEVTVVFDNPTDFFFSGDVRVDGEAGTPDEHSADTIGQGPHAGEPFGDRFDVVDLAPGTSSTILLDFEPGSGEHTIEAVIRRGAEQQWYVPWQSLTVECGEDEMPDLDVDFATIATCEHLVFIVRNNGEDAGVSMTLTPNQDAVQGHAPAFIPLIDEEDETLDVPEDADLVDAAEVSGGTPVGPLGPFGSDEPGNAHAHGFEAFEGLVVTVAIAVGDEEVFTEEISWDESVEGLDCAGDKPGGDDNGQGGELPVTGSATTLIAGGAVVLLALGGGLFLVARRRRVTFTA